MSDRSYSMGSATEMMINDFDDERTLDEEEALEGSEDSHNELSNLQKEGDMPLKELLAKYGYTQRSADNSDSSDQMNVMHGGGDDRLVTEGKGGNEGEDYEDEEEEEEEDDDEDAEEAEDDDEEDEEEGGNSVATKLPGEKIYNQLSLREFYVEMIKMDAKRMCIAGGDENDALECENVGDERREIDPGLSNRRGPIGSVDENDVRGRENEAGSGNNENSTNRGGSSGTGNAGGGGGGSSRLLRSVSRPQSEEEDDDCDYSPDEEEWKKTIMVGSDYQATIPEGLCKYDDALPYENEDKILWNPSFIPKEEVEEFLDRAQLPNSKNNLLPNGGQVRDDEQALYLLLQCGYNLDEALRRRRMNVLPPTDSISLWSEEECHNFESGLRTYGKDFHLIQRNKVRTRSVGELVQFYYLWKKTERHDIFTYKARMEKKKYALHPGITDYMDRFLEEQEGVRDRSSSPNVNCLLYGDAKRQRGSSNTLANNHSEEVKSLDTWDGLTTDDSLGDLNNMATTTASTTTATSGATTTGNSSLTSVAQSNASQSSTTISGGGTTTDNSGGTTTNLSPSSSSSIRTNVDVAPTNNSHDTPRHGYSPSPETVLSNLPP